MKAIDKTFIDHMITNATSINMAVTLSSIVIIILAIVMVTKLFNMSAWDLISKLSGSMGTVVGKRVVYNDI